MPGNVGTIPASVIASWPTPNYVDPVQRSWMPVFAGIMQAASTLLLLLRTFLRIRKHGGGLGVDDIFMFPAFLFATAFTAISIYVTSAGIIGRHIWDVRSTHLIPAAFITWFAQIVFTVGTCCLKISVLLFYRRLVTGSFDKKGRYAIFAAIAFTVAYTLGIILALLLVCRPLDAYWNAWSPLWTHEYHCVDAKAINVLGGVFSAISDLYSVFLPWALLWKVRMARRQKLGLNAIFGVGLIVAVIAFLRAHAFAEVGDSYDVTWTGFWVFFWSMMEYHLGIICACAPALRVFFRQYFSSNETLSRVSQDHERSRVSTRHMSRADALCDEDDDQDETSIAGGGSDLPLTDLSDISKGADSISTKVSRDRDSSGSSNVTAANNVRRRTSAGTISLAGRKSSCDFATSPSQQKAPHLSLHLTNS